MQITIAIGTDHRGFVFKEKLLRYRSDSSHIITWRDMGCMTDERCDYPPFANAVVQEMRAKKAQLGVLLCGSGVGMSIAANRFAGIYAALVWNVEVARQSRADDSSNILVIPADFIDEIQLYAIFDVWLNTQPKSGRYAERIAQIDSWGGI